MTEAEKIKKIATNFKNILTTLGINLKDEGYADTPNRVAKMYVEEIFKGLHSSPPKITTFPNDKGYDLMLIEKDITVFTVCQHHFVPIYGKCHIAYMPGERVIGLSKLIRVAQYFSAKPQIQEGLTMEIGTFLQKILKTEEVAVLMDLKHMCCSMRGARDISSGTVTSFLGGNFKTDGLRQEFFNFVK